MRRVECIHNAGLSNFRREQADGLLVRVAVFERCGRRADAHAGRSFPGLAQASGFVSSEPLESTEEVRGGGDALEQRGFSQSHSRRRRR
jgi:hypothetical protein